MHTPVGRGYFYCWTTSFQNKMSQTEWMWVWLFNFYTYLNRKSRYSCTFLPWTYNWRLIGIKKITRSLSCSLDSLVIRIAPQGNLLVWTIRREPLYHNPDLKDKVDWGMYINFNNCFYCKLNKKLNPTKNERECGEKRGETNLPKRTLIFHWKDNIGGKQAFSFIYRIGGWEFNFFLHRRFAQGTDRLWKSG